MGLMYTISQGGSWHFESTVSVWEIVTIVVSEKLLVAPFSSLSMSFKDLV